MFRHTRFIGADNASNGHATTNVAANADGTILERLEYIQAATAGAAGLASFPAAAAAANGVSIAEVIRYIEDALIGTAGVVTFPAAAAAGNGVSLAEVLRYISDTQLGTAAAAQPRFVEKQHTSPLTTGNIFTFTGTIEIMALWGRVTTVVQSQATTIKTSVVNDALSAYDLGTTVDGNAAAVGTLLSLPAAAGSAHVLTANGVLNPTQDARIIASCTTSGVIKATYGAASTGAILYQMLWRPLSSGAAVAAA